MLLQFNRRPAQLRRVRARFQKPLQVAQATLARGMARGFQNRFCGRFQFIRVLKFVRHLFGAIHIKLIDLATAVFELRKVRGIQVQLLRHLHLAEPKAFSGGNQKFAFFKVS